MPDLLKTLKPNAAGTLSEETHTLGNGSAVLGSAAEMKDGGDYTGCAIDAISDEFDGEDSAARFEYPLDNGNNAWEITSIKVRARLHCDLLDVTPHWTPSLNGVNRGTRTAITDTPTWYEQEFATDPADSQAWTKAKLDALVAGAYVECGALASGSPAILYFDEFQVQVYGALITRGTCASAVGASLAGGAATLITLGSLASCIGSVPTGAHSTHGHTIGSCASCVGEAKESGRLPGPALPLVPTITSLANEPLRAATPADLGDSDIWSWVEDSPIDTNPAVFSGVKADTLVPATPNGAIASITIHVNGYWTLFEGGDNLGETALSVEVGYTTPNGTAQKPADPVSNWTGGFLPNTLGPSLIRRTVVTAPIFHQPNGAPWTWDDLNAMTDITPIVTMNNPYEQNMVNRINEIWVEVQGVGPIDPAARILTQPQTLLTGSPRQLDPWATGHTLSTNIGGSKRRTVVIRK